MIPIVRWKEITKTTEEIVESLKAKADLLTRAVTAPIVAPMFQQMSCFHARLLEYATVLDENLASPIPEANKSSINDAAVACIDWCLIAVQNLKKTEDLESHSLNDTVDHVMQVFQSLQIDKLLTKISRLVELVQGCADEETAHIGRIVVPFLRTLNHTYALLASDLCHAHKSLGKLLYVSLRVFRTLLAKGLCSANAEDSDGDGAGNSTSFEDSVEGTGMGEGDGMKDVSDQIQSEDQLDGLKGESGDGPRDPPKNPLTEEERDMGVEMQQEFDGEMYDVPGIVDYLYVHPSYRNLYIAEDDGSENEGAPESEELEREMGEAGLDNVVDEKQWNNEEDTLDKEAEEKYEDSGAQGDTIQGESHTRDEEMEDDSEKSDRDEEAKEDKGVESGRDLNEFREEDPNEQPHNVESQHDAAEADRSAGDDHADEAGDERDGLDELGNEGETDHPDLPDQMDIEDGGEPEEGEDDMSISSAKDDQVRRIY